MSNSITQVGNITREPELKYLNSGNASVKFGLAVNRRFQKNGEWVEQTSFFDAKNSLVNGCRTTLEEHKPFAAYLATCSSTFRKSIFASAGGVAEEQLLKNQLAQQPALREHIRCAQRCAGRCSFPRCELFRSRLSGGSQRRLIHPGLSNLVLHLLKRQGCCRHMVDHTR